MPVFDYPSVLATGLTILGSVSLLVFAVTLRRANGRLLLWSLANLLFLASRILFSLQPRLDPLLGILLANTFAYCALALFSTTSMVLLSMRPPRLFLSVMGGSLLAAVSLFTWHFPDAIVRIVIMSAGVAATSIAVAVRIAFGGSRSGFRRYPAILATAFAFYGLCFLARAAWYLPQALSPARQPSVASAMPRDFVFSLEAFVSMSLLVALNFLLLVILMARLEREITAKVLEVGESRNELQILYDAFVETAGTIGLDELVPRILDIAVNGFRAKTSALHLVDKDSGELVLLAQRGHDAEAISVLMRPPRGQSVAFSAFEREEAVIWKLGEHPDGMARDSAARQGVAISGSFPIISRGQVLGCLSVGYGDPAALDEARAALLGALSLQLGIVIRAARLHEELERAKARLDVIASTDALTGLANRRTALSALEREAARASRTRAGLAVIMCDIDHFKDFNDRWGHDCGDYVLAGVAALLAEKVRVSDHAARWGGEEFLIILGEAGEEGALALAERIRKAVEAARWDYSGQSLQVTLTLGAAICEAGTRGLDAVAIADEALYEGKRSGRNRVVLRKTLSGASLHRCGDAPSAPPPDEISDVLPV